MTKQLYKIIISSIILIPVVVFFTAWNFYAINIPKWDDHILKLTISELTNAQNWQEGFAALQKQHNEHRIAFTRLMAWLDFKLFGHLNYKHLMLVGNCLLLAAIPLFYTILKNNKKPYFALIPIPFLWLTLAFWENMYWGMASIQNFGVVTLFLYTIYLLISPKIAHFILAILLGLITVVTSGNGLFVLPIGLVILFLNKQNTRLKIWILLSGATIFSYFFWYARNVENPVSGAGILQYAKGYMAFLGSFAEAVPVLDSFKICVFLGALLFLVAISIVISISIQLINGRFASKNEKHTALFTLGALLFVLGTALIVVYSRAGFGIEGLITSKYKIYSVLLLVITYIHIVIPIRGSFLSPYITAIAFLAIVFNIFSYHYHLVDAFNLRKYLTTSQFNSSYDDKTLTTKTDTTLVANVIAKTPVFYTKWIPLLKIAEKQGYAGVTNNLAQLYSQLSISENALDLKISNETYSSQRLLDSGIYVILSSKDRYYVFPANRTRNKSRKELFLQQHYFAPGFWVDIPYSEITKGEYKIGIIRQQGEEIGILFPNKTITVPEVKAEKIKVNW